MCAVSEMTDSQKLMAAFARVGLSADSDTANASLRILRVVRSDNSGCDSWLDRVSSSDVGLLMHHISDFFDAIKSP